MKNIWKITALTALALGLQACGSTSKNSPDEFRVVSKPPLSIPPEFNTMPPKPGEPAAEDVAAPTVAVGVLFPGRTEVPVAPSRSEQNLLLRSGANRVQPDSRSEVGDKETKVVEKGTLISNVLQMEQRNNMPDTSVIKRVASKPIQKQ